MPNTKVIAGKEFVYPYYTVVLLLIWESINQSTNNHYCVANQGESDVMTRHLLFQREQLGPTRSPAVYQTDQKQFRSPKLF